MKVSKLLRTLLFPITMGVVDDEGGGGNSDYAKNENGEALGTNNDARVSLLDSIADNADRVREEEFADIVDLEKGVTEKFTAPARVSEEDEEAAALAADQEAATALAAAEAEAAEAAAAGQAPSIPRIKVNGVEVELTPDLVSKAQKIASADVYLTEAARLRNELATSRPTGGEVASNTPQGTDLVALARAIQMGSEEEAVAALSQLQKAGPSQDDIARTVDERVLFNSALAQFRSDYKDIVGDPILHKLAMEKDDQLVRAGDSRPYYERYAAIGDELRGWVAAKTGSKTPAPVAVQSEKVARKAAAVGAPVTASAKTSSSVQEEREESPSDIIRAMAAQRGGPQWMRTAGLEKV